MPRATFGIGLAASSATGVSSRMVNGLTPGSPAPAVVVEQGSTHDAPLRDAADVDVGTDLQWTNPTGRPGLVVVLFMGDPDYPIWVGGFWGAMAEVPALALAPPAPPPGQNIVLQSTLQHTLLISDVPPTPATGGIILKSATGAMIVVNDSGIYIQNGKGASIIMVGPTITVNQGALVIT